jgi:hypothetical protein
MRGTPSASRGVDAAPAWPRLRRCFVVAGAAAFLVVGGCGRRDVEPVRKAPPRSAEAGDLVGVLRPSAATVFLTNSFGGGTTDLGLEGVPSASAVVVGDWNGDDRDTLGFFDRGTFYLSGAGRPGGRAEPNPSFARAALQAVTFGLPDDQPVAGDWDGDGMDTIGVYRGGTFHLRNSLDAGPADRILTFGVSGDRALAGDWDGDGIATVGVYRAADSLFYLSNNPRRGVSDVVVTYGVAGDIPIVGDWDGDGRDTVGVYREGVFYLRNSNTSGEADRVVALGMVGDLPLAGRWLVPEGPR